MACGKLSVIVPVDSCQNLVAIFNISPSLSPSSSHFITAIIGIHCSSRFLPLATSEFFWEGLRSSSLAGRRRESPPRSGLLSFRFVCGYFCHWVSKFKTDGSYLSTSCLFLPSGPLLTMFLFHMLIQAFPSWPSLTKPLQLCSFHLLETFPANP